LGQRYTSRYKGVRRSNCRTKPWTARISIDGERRYLGCFSTEEEAAAAYRAAATTVQRQRNRWVSAVRVSDNPHDPMEIELTRGKWAKVDIGDAFLVIGGCWGFDGWYATGRVDGRRVQMHRLIMGLADDDLIEVDHINHDGLDNRRANLRGATQTQNLANMRKTRGSSQYKGVSWAKRAKRWRAHIKTDGKERHLGQFLSGEEAVRAYSAAAREAWGEFANLNVVE
jgi:hypothetical protein